LISKRGF